MTLTPQDYRPRLVDEEVQKELRAAGAVSIEGPRWCGKTYVGRNCSNSECLVSARNAYGVNNKDLIEADMRVALDGEAPRLIDEWQELPSIWDAVKLEVDEHHYRGHYVLTGSSTPKVKAPMHNGAGRINIVHMRTMSLFESGDSTGEVSLMTLFNGGEVRSTCSADYGKLVELTLRGGWPGILGWDLESCMRNVAGYIDDQVNSAITMDGKHRDRSRMLLVLRSLARNESTLATMKRMHEDTGIPLDTGGPLISEEDRDADPAVSYNTMADYIDALDRLYLISDQPAFSVNLRSSVKVAGAPKRHLTDPSLSASVLGAGPERLRNDPNTFGFLFEALCERDLDIYIRADGGRLYHYRDYKDREIDAVVELKDGRWGAIEIKVGFGQVDAGARSLVKVRDALVDGGVPAPSFLCVLYGTGGPAYRRPDGVYVVPICALRNRSSSVQHPEVGVVVDAPAPRRAREGSGERHEPAALGGVVRRGDVLAADDERGGPDPLVAVEEPDPHPDGTVVRSRPGIVDPDQHPLDRHHAAPLFGPHPLLQRRDPPHEATRQRYGPPGLPSYGSGTRARDLHLRRIEREPVHRCHEVVRDAQLRVQRCPSVLRRVDDMAHRLLHPAAQRAEVRAVVPDGVHELHHIAPRQGGADADRVEVLPAVPSGRRVPLPEIDEVAVRVEVDVAARPDDGTQIADRDEPDLPVLRDVAVSDGFEGRSDAHARHDALDRDVLHIGYGPDDLLHAIGIVGEVLGDGHGDGRPVPLPPVDVELRSPLRQDPSAGGEVQPDVLRVQAPQYVVRVSVYPHRGSLRLDTMASPAVMEMSVSFRIYITAICIRYHIHYISEDLSKTLIGIYRSRPCTRSEDPN